MAARKKPRTAAQRRATAKMIAANRARSRASNPRRRRSRVSNPPVVAAAPKRRRVAKRKGMYRPTKGQASRAGRVLRYQRYYRRGNPIGLGGFVSEKLVPAAVGGGGALLLDVAMGILPLPATLKTGALAPVVRVAGAVGVGMLAGMVTNKRTADRIAVGALTVTLYQLAKGALVKMLPAGTIPGLSAPEGYEYIGEYVGAEPMLLPDGTVGEYIGSDDLGYIESGMQVGGAEVDGFETGVYR